MNTNMPLRGNAIAGITLTHQQHRSGHKTRVLRVSWCVRGLQRRTTISIDAHGPIAACRRALALRERYMGAPSMSAHRAWALLRTAR